MSVEISFSYRIDFLLQEALVILCFSIRSFNCSLTRKQGKTANNEGKHSFWPKMTVLVFEGFRFLMNLPQQIARENCITFLFLRFVKFFLLFFLSEILRNETVLFGGNVQYCFRGRP